MLTELRAPSFLRVCGRCFEKTFHSVLLKMFELNWAKKKKMSPEYILNASNWPAGLITKILTVYFQSWNIVRLMRAWCEPDVSGASSFNLELVLNVSLSLTLGWWDSFIRFLMLESLFVRFQHIFIFNTRLTKSIQCSTLTISCFWRSGGQVVRCTPASPPQRNTRLDI